MCYKVVHLYYDFSDAVSFFFFFFFFFASINTRVRWYSISY
jgi:hypothetical protein